LDCGSRPIPLFRQKAGIDWNSFSVGGPYNPGDEMPEKLGAFQHIISICHDHGILPVVVFPPIYPAQGETFQNRIRQVSGEDVRFFTYDKENPVYGNTVYYYDDVHLKENGADIFTGEIIHFINTME